MSFATTRQAEEIESLINSAPFYMFNVVANVTVLFWDAFITFDEEIEFIWKAKYGFTKILFIVVRLLSMTVALGNVPIVFGVSDLKLDLCSSSSWFTSFIGTAVIVCANLLMINRAYAFYEKKKYILYILLGVFFAIEIACFFIMAIAVPEYHIVKNPLPPPFPRLTGQCISASSSNSPKMSYVWLPGLLFQFTVFVSVLTRYIRIKAQSRRLGVNVPILYTVFLRDGFYVFVTIAVTYCLCIIYNHRPSYAGLAFALWSFTATSICCTRLILNVHSSWHRYCLRREHIFGSASRLY